MVGKERKPFLIASEKGTIEDRYKKPWSEYEINELKRKWSSRIPTKYLVLGRSSGACLAKASEIRLGPRPVNEIFRNGKFARV